MLFRLLLPLASVAATVPLWAQPQAPQFIEHAMIDGAVERFTGAPAGAPGGARVPVDRRMRLAVCSKDLDVRFHGARVDTLTVACPDPGSWRIFVALNTSMASAAAAPAPAQQVQEIVARGDLVSIMVSGRGFSVQQGGEALEAGAAGDWIRVRPTGSKETLRARISRPGLVTIAGA